MWHTQTPCCIVFFLLQLVLSFRTSKLAHFLCTNSQSSWRLKYQPARSWRSPCSDFWRALSAIPYHAHTHINMPPPSLADRAMPSASFNDFIFAQTLNPPAHHYYHQTGSPSSLFLLIENFAAPTFLSYVVIASTFGRPFWNGGKKYWTDLRWYPHKKRDRRHKKWL